MHPLNGESEFFFAAKKSPFNSTVMAGKTRLFILFCHFEFPKLECHSPSYRMSDHLGKRNLKGRADNLND